MKYPSNSCNLLTDGSKTAKLALQPLRMKPFSLSFVIADI